MSCEFSTKYSPIALKDYQEVNVVRVSFADNRNRLDCASSVKVLKIKGYDRLVFL